jgi:hypothetical protein
MTRRDREARIHAGLIGWDFNQIHCCSKALAPPAA